MWEKVQKLRSMPQEAQQFFFKFVRNPKGEINFRAPPRLRASDSNRQSYQLWIYSNYSAWIYLQILTLKLQPNSPFFITRLVQFWHRKRTKVDWGKNLQVLQLEGIELWCLPIYHTKRNTTFVHRPLCIEIVQKYWYFICDVPSYLYIPFYMNTSKVWCC